MKKRNWLNADELAKKFRLNGAIQSVQNGEVTKGITTQKIVFGGVVVIGAISLTYAIYYFLKQKAEKKKNAELVRQNKKAIELLDQKDDYFNEKISNLQRKVYR